MNNAWIYTRTSLICASLYRTIGGLTFIEAIYRFRLVAGRGGGGLCDGGIRLMQAIRAFLYEERILVTNDSGISYSDSIVDLFLSKV